MARNKALGIQCQAAVDHLKAKVSGLVFPQIPKNTHYVLQPIPAPRYWLPNEPVVLIADEIATPTPRHGQDGRLHAAGLLECQILPLEDSTDQEFIHSLSRIIERLNSEEQGKLNVDRERIGFSAWTEQPWHPFLLEWEVEVMPHKGKYSDLDLDADSRRPLTRNYDSGCITNNYQLAKDAVDLTIKPGQETLAILSV